MILQKEIENLDLKVLKSQELEEICGGFNWVVFAGTAIAVFFAWIASK